MDDWSWLSSLWDTAKDAISSNTGKALLTTGAGVLGNYLTSSSQADQSQQQQQNYQDYKTEQNANYLKYLNLTKPTQSEKNAMYSSGAKKLRTASASAGKTLTENLASRGLGGGQVATGLADNTRTLQSNLGDLRSKVELWGAGSTPTMQQATQAPVTLGTTDYFTSNLGNLMQYGSGLGLSSLLKGGSTTNPTNTYNIDYGNVLDYYNGSVGDYNPSYRTNYYDYWGGSV